MRTFTATWPSARGAAARALALCTPPPPPNATDTEHLWRPPHQHTPPPPAHAGDLFVMPPLTPWPLTLDATTEEVVPGLAPTDGFAVNATGVYNLEPLAPVLGAPRAALPPLNLNAATTCA